jgi:hypothetical protein
MSHQDLALSFSETAFAIKNNCLRDLNPEQVCRAVYSRLYYALYHKYLEHDSSLATSKDKSKHAAVKRRISAKHSHETLILYNNMYALRIWADYDLNKHQAPGAEKTLSTTLTPLMEQINKFINSATFK